jgi:uncharacterized membrane protein (UPF0127 family)
MQTRAALVALFCALACAPSGPTATVATGSGPVRVTLEVAADDATRTRGLMYRNHLDDGHGMLFVFEEEVEHPFWMRNTVIPLDMIFIGADQQIVGIKANTTPLSLAQVTVGRPSKWVLEVAGGYAARAGMAAGDKIEFDGVPNRVASR